MKMIMPILLSLAPGLFRGLFNYVIVFLSLFVLQTHIFEVPAISTLLVRISSNS